MSQPIGRAFQLTGAGPGAIAVVRLTGPGTAPFLQTHFSKSPVRGRPVHGDLRDGDVTIDDAVVVLLPEGGADLNLHGGPWIISAVLDLARREGFEVQSSDADVPPLEAVEGATLLDREIGAHLPLARTQLGVRALVAQADAWARLIESSAPGPADLRHLSRWMTRAQSIRADLAGILADRSLWWLLHPPTVAVIGAPNVGKSTLANRLFARELAIIADLPGTTRDWVGEIANLDGLPILLIDTPGLRQTDDPIERQAIAHSEAKIESADLVVVVIDAARPLADQGGILDAWPHALRVINKVDAAPAFGRSLVQALPTVATTGEGIDDLRAAIRARFGIPADFDPARPRWCTARQRRIIEDSLSRVELIRRMTEAWPG